MSKNEDLGNQIQRLTSDLNDRTTRLDQYTSNFNSKDKEAVQLVMVKTDLEKQNASLKQDNDNLSVYVKELTQVKINSDLEIQNL